MSGSEQSPLRKALVAILIASQGMRIDWRERTSRIGWEILYTSIGGRFSYDPVSAVRPQLRSVVERSLSQVMCAVSSNVGASSEDSFFLAAVIKKIVQRGVSPRIFHTDSELFSIDRPSQDEALAAVAGLAADDWLLDPSILLDPTWERPLWDLIKDRAPAVSRWLTPQAWFEGLTSGDHEGSRWVDFLLHAPWIVHPGVIEVDGSGHAQQQLLDQERVSILKKAGCRVTRLEGRQSTDLNSPVISKLVEHANHVALQGAAEHLVLATHGAAAIHRFLFAIAQGLERGFLRRGEAWSIELTDQVGIVREHANIALDLVAALNDAWNLDVVPPQIAIGTRTWSRCSDGRFRKSPQDSVGSGPPSVSVFLEPFTPAHAALPNPSKIPTIVMRGCLIPVDLQWAQPKTTGRRNRTGNERSLAALDRLLQDLFGYQGFREGQRESVSRLLSGGDSLVLLPTGAGKTLIYQLAGLLRPGVTVVVSPLKALIDDQERRLREQGISRVIGFHSGLSLTRAESSKIQKGIADGEALFVLVAPERFQIAEFRKQVSAAADTFLVNLCVVDEAHCVSEWGHQFRTSYLKLGRNLRLICAGPDDVKPPMLALTATASPRVLADLQFELDFDTTEPGLIHRPADFRRPNLHYRVFRTEPDQRPNAVATALEWVSAELGVNLHELGVTNGELTRSGIIFVPHGRSGLALGIAKYRDEISRLLQIPFDEISLYAGKKPGDLSLQGNEGRRDWESVKRQFADDFRMNHRPVMVSTKAFGMGIDKPNIRYTVHVCLSSSIEEFAQESGRAGRDGKDSYCALVAPAGLEEGVSRIDRRSQFARSFADDDIGVQLKFLRESFRSADEDIKAAEELLTELLLKNPTKVIGGQSLKIPMRESAEGDDTFLDGHLTTRERAIFRLLLIGLLDDYTIDYGSRSYTVYFNYFSGDDLVKTTRGFIGRVTGGNRESTRNVVDVSPAEDVYSVAKRCVDQVIHAVHERIEPARALALREMLALSRVDDPETIADRINAYLSEGPVSSLLDRFIQQESNVSECLAALSGLVPDEFEWAGAATRFLESYPDNPVLLAVRALGEAWRRDGSRADFRRYIDELCGAAASYGLTDEEFGMIIVWTLDLLRRYFSGRRREWCADIWKRVSEINTLDETLHAAEVQVLEAFPDDASHSSELDAVLARQIRRTRERVKITLDT